MDGTLLVLTPLSSLGLSLAVLFAIVIRTLICATDFEIDDGWTTSCVFDGRRDRRCQSSPRYEMRVYDDGSIAGNIELLRGRRSRATISNN